MTKRDKLFNCIASVLALGAIWLAWLIAYFAVKNDTVIPSVGDTFAEMGRLLFGQERAAFWRAFGNTLLRAVEAFALSFVLGLALALLAFFVKYVRAFFAPIVSVLRTIPTLALVLILLLWTSPFAATVIIALLVLFPVFYVSILSALDEVREEHGQTVRAFRVPLVRQAISMYLPLAAPPVLKQMGADLSLGLKVTVSGEVLALTAHSLGRMMQYAATMLIDMPQLMALTLLTVATGFFFEGIFWLLSKAVVRWRT